MIRRRGPALVAAVLTATACGDAAVEPEDFATVEGPPGAGVWSPGPPLPFPVPAQSGAALASAAYVAGPVRVDGVRSGIVLRLGTDERWTLLPFVPHAGTRFDLTVLADTLHALARDTLAPDGGLALVAWHTDDAMWDARPPPPVGAGGAAVAVGASLFLVGGEGASHVYDAPSRSWSTLPAAPTPRADAVARSHAGRVWLFGPAARGAGAPLEVLDPATGVWEGRGATPLVDGGIMSATLGGRFHFFGGLAAGATRPRTAHLAFDPETGAWDTLPGIPTPRAGGAAFTFDGAACLLAGEERDPDQTPRPTGTVDKYRETR